MKYQKRHKVEKAQRHKVKNSVPLCLCALMLFLRYGVRQNRRTSVPDEKGLAPLEITPTSRRSVKSLMGFSFMELMTVVAIIAILIIASMPAFRNYARSKNLKEGTNMIVSALRKTRDAAITYRKRYRTVFDTVNDAVAIYVDGDDFNPVEKWVKLPEFVIFSSTTVTVRNFPKGSASADLRYAEFKISGAANEGGSIILLDESTQNTKKISFNNITGRIRVEE